MDLDEVPEAGPSKIVKTNGATNGDSDEPSECPLFYPAAIDGIAPTHLSGTQDLLTLFRLSPSYDTFVRPYLSVAKQQAGQTTGEDVKGKGRAINGQDGDGQATVDTANAGAGARDRTRIMKKHYSHMIQDVPGQNKLAKDHHLRDLLLNPDPPDHVKLLPFDSNALRDAFTLQVGTLPDFDTSIWRADATDERKKKKKRKQDDGPGANGINSAAPSPAAPGISTGQPGGKKRRVGG